MENTTSKVTTSKSEVFPFIEKDKEGKLKIFWLKIKSGFKCKYMAICIHATSVETSSYTLRSSSGKLIANSVTLKVNGILKPQMSLKVHDLKLFEQLQKVQAPQERGEERRRSI